MELWTKGEKINKTDDNQATFKENKFLRRKKNKITAKLMRIKLTRIERKKIKLKEGADKKLKGIEVKKIRNG
ncbi:MAG TPA: hypothetical protein QGH92_01475 [Candidatus Parcubacteria bacterium]|nr:hypothetical protein [Candidatus Parcubacteria bacterium]